MHVVTSGIAYKIQYPNKSLQMSLLLLGEQGTGKSFVGNVVKRVIDGDRLAGMVVAANSDLLAKADKFLLGSIAESLVTYVDEAKRNRDGSSMVKLINRGGILQTQNKYEPLKQVAFNGLVIYITNEIINLGDIDSQDRAIFCTRSVDRQTMNQQLILPNPPGWAELVLAIKRFIRSFDERWKTRRCAPICFTSSPPTRPARRRSRASSIPLAAMPTSLRPPRRRAACDPHVVERGGLQGKWNQCWDEEDGIAWLLDRYGGRTGAPSRDMPNGARFISALQKAGLFSRWNGMMRPLIPWGTAIEMVRQKTGLDVSPVRQPTVEECDDTLPDSKLILPPPRKF